MLTLEQIREEGRKALLSRKFHPYHDLQTYGKWFEHFKKSKQQDQFLKLIWAHSVKWSGDPIELARIAPDICPVFGTPLDYGRGFNKVSNPNINNMDGFFQPTVDHRTARTHGGKDSIDNYVIVSRKANQFKSDMNSEEELDHFYEGMKKTYFNEKTR